MFIKTVAVVGSRRMTDYGRRAIDKMVPQLVTEGWTIVSGFMYGVDQHAHRVCVDCGGKTIAVLGWGISQTLEASDQKLANDIIAAGGLMLSEWESQKPMLWTFPARNRIVAAISREVIVVEAAAKSGALITVELAERLKRQIWAVPGPITSKVSEGTNRLIAAGRAQMWLPAAQLKFSLETADPIVQLVESEPLDASEIARRLNQPIDQVGSKLSLLVLSGAIMEREGKYYAG